MATRGGSRAVRGRGKAEAKQATKPKGTDDVDELTLDQIKEETIKAANELAEVRRNRNFYQLERDQVQLFQNITEEEVKRTEAHIRNIEWQMEKMQDTHRNDIKIYLQKVIHLEYEHANNVDAVHDQNVKDKTTEEQQFLRRKTEKKKDRLQHKTDLKAEELAYEEETKTLKEVERKELQKLRQEFERNHRELEGKYEQRLKELRDDLELRRKMEIHEIEERKNRHINDLMKNHEKAFNEMKNYYNAITQDNLSLIKTLNDDIEDLKVAHIQNEKAMEEIEKKNKALSAPLAEAEAHVKALRHKLQNYEKDKASLKHAKARLNVLEEQFKRTTIEHKTLSDRYRGMESERDELYRAFEDTVSRVQRRTEAKNQVLEKMLDEYKDIFEVKKAQFTQVLRASNLDPVVLQNVTKKLDDVLSAKNERINELHFETSKAIKAHNDLVRAYDAKLAALGIPEHERHLEPLIGSSHTAPADLIA